MTKKVVAQDPTCKFSIFPLNTLKEKPVTNPLEDKGKEQDPRPGHGMYNKMKKSISVEIPATHAEEDTPDNPPFIIENKDKTLSYVPDKVAEDLVNNLIKFLDTCDQQQIPGDLKISSKEDNLITPAAPEITDEMDLLIDFWPTIYFIGITPPAENVGLIKREDFQEDLK